VTGVSGLQKQICSC